MSNNGNNKNNTNSIGGPSSPSSSNMSSNRRLSGTNNAPSTSAPPTMSPMDMSGRSINTQGSTSSTTNSNTVFPGMNQFTFPNQASPAQQQQQLMQFRQQQLHLQQQQIQLQQHMQAQQYQHQMNQQQQHSPSYARRTSLSIPQHGSPNAAAFPQQPNRPSPSSSASSTSVAAQQQQPQQHLMHRASAAANLATAVPPPPLTTTMNPAQRPSPQSASSSIMDNPSKHSKPETAAATTSTSKRSVPTTSTPTIPPQEAADSLRNAPWTDKAIWASRQFLGGRDLNGFLRSTNAIKKLKRLRKKQTPAANTTDEQYKLELMNPKTAKRIKTELEQGMEFCSVLHATIRTMLWEADNNATLPPPLRTTLVPPTPSSTTTSTKAKASAGSFARRPLVTTKLPTATNRAGPLSRPLPLQRSSTSTSTVASATTTTTSAPTTSKQQQQPSPTKRNSTTTSTLRSRRKKKLPPYRPKNPPPTLPQGRYSDQDHLARLATLIRYRPLLKDDLVAARLSSRDVWILARVVARDVPGPKIEPAEFLRLSDTRRDQLMESVIVQDVEDANQQQQQQTSSSAGSNNHTVARSRVLPLPRNHSEAAAWCSTYYGKQHTRVYAMYPATTALYTAVVVDGTTYCQGDDDIVVVQFDGDEETNTATGGVIPQWHIPARFVALAPPNDEQEQAVTVAASMALGDPLADLDDLQFDDSDLPDMDGLDFDF